MHVVGLLSTATSIQQLHEMVQSAAVVFSSVSSDVKVETHFKNLQTMLLQIGDLKQETVDDDVMDEHLEVYTQYLCICTWSKFV